MQWLSRDVLPKVKFTAEEMAEYRQIAANRNDPRKKKGFNAKRFSRTHSHILGVMGEAAAADWFGVEFDRRILISGDGDVEDLNIGGVSIQVKTTSNFRGDLIYNSADDFKADVAVLVWADPDKSCAVVQGWCDRQSFLRHCRTSNYGYGPRAAMDKILLEPIGDLNIKPDHTPDEIDLKTAFLERAAIIEFDGRHSRAMAERLARIEIYGR